MEPVGCISAEEKKTLKKTLTEDVISFLLLFHADVADCLQDGLERGRRFNTEPIVLLGHVLAGRSLMKMHKHKDNEA